MTRALVLSGQGRYADPWHPFAETSDAVAEVVTDLGWAVEVRASEAGALADLSGVDVLVVNTGGGDPASPPTPDAAWQRDFEHLQGHVDAGRPVLALHAAANTFPDWEQWPEILGGRWVRGTSTHPELSHAVFEACPEQASHPVFAGLPTGDQLGLPELGPCILCHDERYSELTVHAGSVALLRHHTAGRHQVCAWLNGSVLYDGLGHDARSYASASRRRFLANCLTHLVGAAGGA